MPMAPMFKTVATKQLKLLVVIFLLGNSFRVLPAADPADACRRSLYARLVATNYFLVVTVLAAATLLLAVLGVVANTAAKEAAVGAVRRPSASLRATLLLAVVLSVAASILAVLAFEDGLPYRTGTGTGCGDGGFGAGSAVGIVLTCLVGVVHGFSAWIVAVSQD